MTSGPGTSIFVNGDLIVKDSQMTVGGQHGSVNYTQNDIGAIQIALKKELNQTLHEDQFTFLENKLQQKFKPGVEQKLITLAGLDASLVNSLITFAKAQTSICMIAGKDVSDNYFMGTAFLASIPTISGLEVAFMSAGHNFEDILSSTAGPDALYKFTIHFGNISGIWPNLVEGRRGTPVGSHTDYHQPINLGVFLEPFNVCGSISNKGKRVLFQNGRLITQSLETRRDNIGLSEDYCVLQLNHHDVAGCLKQKKLDFFPCGTDEYLDCKHTGLVAIIGHPGIEEDQGNYPLRFSFGAEKDPDMTPNFYKDANPIIKILSMFFDDVGLKKKWKGGPDGYPNKDAVKNYLFYDNDTFGGNSGSPVIGRGDTALTQGYCVKGIHVQRFNEANTNGAQKIHQIQKWIDLGKNYVQP